MSLESLELSPQSLQNWHVLAEQMQSAGEGMPAV